MKPRKLFFYIFISVLSTVIISVIIFNIPQIYFWEKFSALFLLIITVSFLLSKKITKPLKRIIETAKNYSQGKFRDKLEERATEEISNLTDTLNEMAEQLKERIEKISLRKNEQEAMFSSMKEGVLAINPNEEIIRINSATAKFFGIPSDPQNLIGKRFYEFIRNKPITDFINEALKSEEHLQKEITVTSDKERNLLVFSDPIFNSSGGKIGTVFVINNITKVKQLDKVRQEFVANVSHELKTPITTIKGYVETLLSTENIDVETEKNFLQIINKHSERLNSLIDDLLQLAKLDGTKEIPLQKTELLPILKEATHCCEEKIKAKNITFEIHCHSNLEIEVNSGLFEQALVNLIDNAVKYSYEDGKIILECNKKKNKISVSVIDFGVGIPKEHQSRLFERFYRVDKGRSRDLGGTGLGLAIVKHIALVHNGKVYVESSHGEGSKFTIELPS